MRRLLLALAVFFVPTSPAHAAWVWPVTGEVITPYSNGTDPYAAGQHRGIDIAASVGTAVVAAAGGEVRFAGTAGTSGLTIGIRTADGYDTSYLHLSSLAVRAGAHVMAGERIGAVGTTGTRSATATHLHFGVRDAGTRHAYHDPLAFLPPPLAPAPKPPTPAPAPAPEPAPPTPSTAPVPTSAPSPHSAPAPRGAPFPDGAPFPRAAPAPRDAPAPRGAPSPRGAPVARGAPVPHVAPDGSPAFAPGTVSAGTFTGARSRALRLARHPSGDPGRPDRPLSGAAGEAVQGTTRLDPTDSRSVGSANGLPSDRPHQAAPGVHVAKPEGDGSRGRHAAGPDIAWALACGGLLLAAAILGLTGDGRHARRRAARAARRGTDRTGSAGALRPLAGGH